MSTGSKRHEYEGTERDWHYNNNQGKPLVQSLQFTTPNDSAVCLRWCEEHLFELRLLRQKILRHRRRLELKLRALVILRCSTRDANEQQDVKQ